MLRPARTSWIWLRAAASAAAVVLPKYRAHRFCSQDCGVPSKGPRDPRPERRKVDRPPYEQLVAEVAALGFSAVGRKHGVSDNAVRKWIRWYEARRRLDEELEDAA